MLKSGKNIFYIIAMLRHRSTVV